MENRVDHRSIQKVLKGKVRRPKAAKRQFILTSGQKMKFSIQLPSWRSIAITVFVLAATLAAIKGISHISKGEAIAVVNGEKITLREFINALNAEAGRRDPVLLKDPTRARKFKKELLESLIKNQLILGEAKKAGTILTEEELDRELTRLKSSYSEASFQTMLKSRGISYSDWKDLKIKKLLIQKFLDTRLADDLKVTDDDIGKYYNNRIEEFKRPEEVHARQIVVDSEAKAVEILDKLKKDANFAVLAAENSISPDAKKGGDLGTFPRGVYPSVFDETCFRLQPGQLSGVVKSEYGYHIFKVIAKKPPRTLPLAEVKDIISARLRQNGSADFLDKWYGPVRAKAKIKINNKLLTNTTIPESEEGA